jgi:hypothetical protein
LAIAERPESLEHQASQVRFRPQKFTFQLILGLSELFPDMATFNPEGQSGGHCGGAA